MGKKVTVEEKEEKKVEEKKKRKPRGPNKPTDNRDKITRAKAIRLFCNECMNFQIKLVNSCTDEACPLWCFRKGIGMEHTDIRLRTGK